MTTALTITDRVTQMHAARAAEPPNEVMAAFGREQPTWPPAGSQRGRTVGTGRRRCTLTRRRPHHPPCSARRSASVVVFYRGVWCPYCNIALSTYQSELLPHLGAGRQPRRGQPAGTRWVAEHDREERPLLPGRLRPCQRHRQPARYPHRALTGRPRGATPARVGPDRGQRGRHHHVADADRGDPRRRACCDGSMSTPTTAPAPKPSRSSTPSTSSAADHPPPRKAHT